MLVNTTLSDLDFIPRLQRYLAIESESYFGFFFWASSYPFNFKLWMIVTHGTETYQLIYVCEDHGTYTRFDVLPSIPTIGTIKL